MSIRLILLIGLPCLYVLTATSCRSASEVAAGKPIQPIAGADSIRVPGPSSIRPDGSVRNRQMDAPNGRLLKTMTATSLRRQQVDPWAKNQVLIVANSRNLNPDQVEGWIRITGPRELLIDEAVSAQLYDVTLEVWKLADTPRKRQREVE